MNDATQLGLMRCLALIPTTAIERFPQAFSRFLVELRESFGGYRLTAAQFDSSAGVVDDADTVSVSVDIPPYPGCLGAFDAMTARAARDLRERSVMVSIGTATGIILAEDRGNKATSIRRRNVA